MWGIVGVLLLAVGGIGAGILATLAGPLTWAHLLVAPGIEPPWYVTLLPIALGTSAAIVGPRPLRRPVADLTSLAWRGTWSVLLVLVATAIITVWAVTGPIADALSDGTWWQATAAILALAAMPLALIAVLVLPRLLGRRPAYPPARVASTMTSTT